jgi:hypothetical protein
LRTRWIAAAVLVLVGAVWVGQGTGLIRGSSFMTDDIRWAAAGVVLVVAGLAIGGAEIRSRYRS